MTSRKPLIVLIALAGAVAAGAVQARGNGDVQWSVTVGAPLGVPVYTQGYPVQAYPAQAYPVQVLPAPAQHRVVYRQPTRWDVDGDGIPNRDDRVYNPVWDVDGDGIPNRNDRAYNPRWDRDGDGLPNRYDRVDNRRWDRDGDGVPNWRDPRPNDRRFPGR